MMFWVLWTTPHSQSPTDWFWITACSLVLRANTKGAALISFVVTHFLTWKSFARQWCWGRGRREAGRESRHWGVWVWAARPSCCLGSVFPVGTAGGAQGWLFWFWMDTFFSLYYFLSPNGWPLKYLPYFIYLSVLLATASYICSICKYCTETEWTGSWCKQDSLSLLGPGVRQEQGPRMRR